jgi:hypothetical protein
MAEPYLSDEQVAGRINCKGQIPSLSSAFKLKGEVPFSLFIIPVADSTAPIIVSARLVHESVVGNCPFNVNCWNEPSVVELPANAINLTNYTVYWGAGTFAEVETA